MIFEIKHRWNGAVLHSCEANNIKEAVIDAVKKRAYLRGADLQGADLQGAYLRGADLRGKIKIQGWNPVLIFIGGGSVGRAVYAFNCDVGIYIEAGCFFGTLDEFREKTLKDTNGDKTHKKAMQYLGFANIAALSFDAPEQVKL